MPATATGAVPAPQMQRQTIGEMPGQMPRNRTGGMQNSGGMGNQMIGNLPNGPAPADFGAQLPRQMPIGGSMRPIPMRRLWGPGQQGGPFGQEQY